MDDYKKCMLVDKCVILCGVLGFIADVVAIILGLNGVMNFDINYVILLPVSIFFIFYGAKTLKRDKERFGDK